MVKTSGDTSPLSQLKTKIMTLSQMIMKKACLLNNYFCYISALNDSNTSRPDFPLRTNVPIDLFFILPRVKYLIFHKLTNFCVRSEFN